MNWAVSTDIQVCVLPGPRPGTQPMWSHLVPPGRYSELTALETKVRVDPTTYYTDYCMVTEQLNKEPWVDAPITCVSVWIFLNWYSIRS